MAEGQRLDLFNLARLTDEVHDLWLGHCTRSVAAAAVHMIQDPEREDRELAFEIA